LLTARAGDAEVRAPIDGTVLALRVERGETVTLNQPLLRVGDLSRLRVEALVDEADVGRLRVGTEAALRLPAFDDRLVRGRITHLAPQADRDRKTFEVDLSLDDAPEGLRPGMTAEINLISRRHENVLLAPAEALARGASSLLVARGGRVVRVPVTAGIRDLTRVEVAGDLLEGEWVVLESVPEGTRVRPQLRLSAAAGAAAVAR
jgi:HlyD family secretion protein